MRTRFTLLPVPFRVAGLIVLTTLTPGCGDDDHGPTAPLVAPTPTPPVGLNGAWSGTVRYGGRVLFFCGVEQSSVTANVRQSGSAVSASLASRCWNGASLRATLTGDALTGTATLGDYCDPRTVTGTYSGGILRLQIAHISGEICHPGGSAELHR
jgi:hypothetical protein